MWLFGLAAEQGPADDASDQGARDRRKPEEPELFDIGLAGENRRAGAARGIDRGVGHRNGNQMDEGQGQTDRERRETHRRAR